MVVISVLSPNAKLYSGMVFLDYMRPVSMQRFASAVAWHFSRTEGNSQNSESMVCS